MLQCMRGKKTIDGSTEVQMDKLDWLRSEVFKHAEKSLHFILR